MKTWMICAVTGMGLMFGAVTVAAAPSLGSDSAAWAKKDAGVEMGKDGGKVTMGKDAGKITMGKDAGKITMGKDGGVQAEPLAAE